MSTFELSDIQKSYGANKVLDGITLTLNQGEVTAIVGDNGAGKSTFLKIMAGVVEPDAGSVTLDGARIDQTRPGDHRRQGIEMVYQDLALAQQHDLVTNLFLGREHHNWLGFLRRKEMVDLAQQSLHLTGIEIKDRRVPVGKLSGGQQQAIAIARALMFNPRVLLLDEPTAALAVREVDRVIKLIQEQKLLKRIIVLVSHRLNDVFALSDRILVMKQGKLVADTTIAETSVSQVIERIVS